jgi:hypothetical protein
MTSVANSAGEARSNFSVLLTTSLVSSLIMLDSNILAQWWTSRSSNDLHSSDRSLRCWDMARAPR